MQDDDITEIGGLTAWTGAGQPINLNGGDAPFVKFIEGSTGGPLFRAAPPTITDLDGNGKMDIVVTSIRDRTFVPSGQSAAFKNRSSIYAWEFDAPAAQSACTAHVFLQLVPPHT